MNEPGQDNFRFSGIAEDELGNRPYTGTKALMLAVLENGIASYLSPSETQRIEAEQWIGTRVRRSPFAFNVICETLGLDPDAVRMALRRMRSEDLSTRRVTTRSRPNVRRSGRILGRKAI